MRWLRAVAVPVLMVPGFGVSWLMTTALLMNTGGWAAFEAGAAFGALMAVVDLVRGRCPRTQPGWPGSGTMSTASGSTGTRSG